MDVVVVVAADFLVVFALVHLVVPPLELAIGLVPCSSLASDASRPRFSFLRVLLLVVEFALVSNVDGPAVTSKELI